MASTPARPATGLLAGGALRDRSPRFRARSSFERLFRRHHAELFRYCLGIVGTASDAEDALQQTMLAALRSLPDERRAIAVRPWLFRVAHNNCISILRARREHAPLEDALLPAAEDDRLETRERLRQLVADLQRLPERQRSALLMRELSGLGFDEIAAALDCSEGAARQTVYAARVALEHQAEGRSMDCAEARQAISDGDRRRLRGRRLRAHLGVCEPCADFRAAIELRREDLRALFPPIAPAAGSALIASILGSGSTPAAGVGGAAGAGAGGVLAGAIGTAGIGKAAAVLAAAAVAGGAAGASGLVELPTGATTTAAEGGPAAASAVHRPAGSGKSGDRARAVGSGAGAPLTRRTRSDGGRGTRGERAGASKPAAQGRGSEASEGRARGAGPPAQSGSGGSERPPQASPPARSNPGRGGGSNGPPPHTAGGGPGSATPPQAGAGAGSGSSPQAPAGKPSPSPPANGLGSAASGAGAGSNGKAVGKPAG